MKTIQTLVAATLLIATGMVVSADASARVRCHDVVVYHDRPAHNHDNRVAGTVIGAVAGGVIGHQIGGGNGKTLATVGGAVAGGAGVFEHAEAAVGLHDGEVADRRGGVGAQRAEGVDHCVGGKRIQRGHDDHDDLGFVACVCDGDGG